MNKQTKANKETMNKQIKISVEKPKKSTYVHNNPRELNKPDFSRDFSYAVGYNAIIPKNPKALIIGTIPSPEGYKKYGFYYMNEGNYFWNGLEYALSQNGVANDFISLANEYRESFDTTNIVKELKRADISIALFDVFESCIRSNGKDSTIMFGNYNSLDTFKRILENDSLLRVFCTSRDAQKHLKELLKGESSKYLKTIANNKGLTIKEFVQTIKTPSKSNNFKPKNKNELEENWKNAFSEVYKHSN